MKGTELKQDLAKLDSYYSSFPDEIREQGIMKFAHHPPLEGKYLTSMLWDRFGQGWREHARNPLVISPEQERELIDKIDRTVEKNRKSPSELVYDTKIDEPSSTTFVYRVPGKRGKWRMVPRVRNKE